MTTSSALCIARILECALFCAAWVGSLSAEPYEPVDMDEVGWGNWCDAGETPADPPDADR